jgi:adenosylcobinamide-phosphate synthase
MQGRLEVVLLALLFDALIGDPEWLWKRLPHPVVIIGRGLVWCERIFNRAHRPRRWRRVAGIVVVIVMTAVSFAIGACIEILLGTVPGGFIALGLVASTLIAQRSLYQHVARVSAAFKEGGVVAARAAVSRIVGRDPKSLDDGGVCRAAIESCAENFSDGVVAPAFWLALLGLPGLIAYKAINTADSMIGHRSARYADFGWAAARLDDLVNLVPARLAGVLLALVAPVAGGSIAAAFATMLRDARTHRSPNAGWPESAMAGALNLALAGPRRYPEGVVDDPYLNAAGRLEATPADIFRALRVMVAACMLQGSLYATLAFVL